MEGKGSDKCITVMDYKRPETLHSEPTQPYISQSSFHAARTEAQKRQCCTGWPGCCNILRLGLRMRVSS